MRSNGSSNSAQNSASIQKTGVRISSCSSRPQIQSVDRRADRRDGSPGDARRGTKSGGRLIAQARAPLLDESLEDPADRLPQAAQILDVDSGRRAAAASIGRAAREA